MGIDSVDTKPSPVCVKSPDLLLTAFSSRAVSKFAPSSCLPSANRQLSLTQSLPLVSFSSRGSVHREDRRFWLSNSSSTSHAPNCYQPATALDPPNHVTVLVLLRPTIAPLVLAGGGTK